MCYKKRMKHEERIYERKEKARDEVKRLRRVKAWMHRHRFVTELFLVFLTVFLLFSVNQVGAQTTDPEPFVYVTATNPITPGMVFRITNESVLTWRYVTVEVVTPFNESEVVIQDLITGGLLAQANFSYHISLAISFKPGAMASFRVVVDNTWTWDFRNITVAREGLFDDWDFFQDQELVREITFTLGEYEWKIIELHVQHLVVGVIAVVVGVSSSKREKDYSVEVLEP